jgi:hypothetical protein
MKTLRTASIALAMAVMAAAPARGQQPSASPPAAAPAPAPAPSPVLTALLEGITLTAQQRLKVDSILTHFRSEAPPLEPGTEPDSAMLVRFRALSQQSLDGVRTVLTREQQQVWDRNVEHVKAASLRVGP